MNRRNVILSTWDHQPVFLWVCPPQNTLVKKKYVSTCFDYKAKLSHIQTDKTTTKLAKTTQNFGSSFMLHQFVPSRRPSWLRYCALPARDRDRAEAIIIDGEAPNGKAYGNDGHILGGHSKFRSQDSRNKPLGKCEPFPVLGHLSIHLLKRFGS